MGPGNPADLPARNLELLQGRTPQGPMAVWLRTGHHPVAAWLKEKGSEWQSFDSWYDEAGDFQDLYTRIVERLTAMAPVVYGVPGHPLVGETTVRLLLERAQAGTVQVELMGAQSFLEAVATAVGQDLLGQGVEVVDAHLPAGWMPRGDRPLLVGQLWHRLMPGQLKLRLLDVYPAEHSIAVVQAAGVPAQEKVTWIPLLELDRHEFAGPLTSVWVPALPAGVSPHSLGQKMVRVVETVARLRGEGGCPWDREQTHTSLRPYVIEEAYEVAEVLRALGTEDRPGDKLDKLAEELGDLLLQVALHAQIAHEEGAFDLGSVCDLLVDKLIRRHPHVFGSQEARSPAQVLRRWNQIKQAERGDRASVLDGIPDHLPALQKAWRVQGRAHEVGFDWEPGDVAGVLAKVEEELRELREEVIVSQPCQEAVERELGDVLFAAVNLARILNVDPEVALLEAVDRFSARFRTMEDMGKERGLDLTGMTMTELDVLWEAAKQQEGSKSCRIRSQRESRKKKGGSVVE